MARRLCSGAPESPPLETAIAVAATRTTAASAATITNQGGRLSASSWCAGRDDVLVGSGRSPVSGARSAAFQLEAASVETGSTPSSVGSSAIGGALDRARRARVRHRSSRPPQQQPRRPCAGDANVDEWARARGRAPRHRHLHPRRRGATGVCVAAPSAGEGSSSGSGSASAGAAIVAGPGGRCRRGAAPALCRACLTLDVVHRRAGRAVRS